MASDKKHLRQRGNVWWLHYRIPDRFKLLPECLRFNGILTKSLETDSLREAKRRRDVFLYGLEAQASDHYKAWLPKKTEVEPFHTESKVSSFVKSPKTEHPNAATIKSVIARGSSILGKQPSADKLKQVANWERDAVFALLKTQRTTGRSLNELTKLVVKEAETQGKAKKTLYKIERGSSWFLDHIIQNDIDIADIDHDQVREFLLSDQDRGVAGSTLKGHLYGLRQIWKRAKQSKIVSGDNPFMEHTIRSEKESFAAFTYEEIYKLYRHADGELKILIHAGATTGARADELLTAEVKTLSTFDHKCWLFKFKQKGKTVHSTRVVPLHDSLQLDEGFHFKLKYKTVQNQMKELQSKVLGERLDELTGKPRKLSFHSLRSTVITELVVNKRINEKVTGSITGHLGGGMAKVGSLRGYINTDDLKAKKDVVDLLPWNI